jgi:hypothetical protein
MKKIVWFLAGLAIMALLVVVAIYIPMTRIYAIAALISASMYAPMIAGELRHNSASNFFLYGLGCVGWAIYFCIISCDITAPLEGKFPGEL